LRCLEQSGSGAKKKASFCEQKEAKKLWSFGPVRFQRFRPELKKFLRRFFPKAAAFFDRELSCPEPVSAAALLRDRKFMPLFITQLLGAINDNLFKNALVVLALYRLAHLGPVLVALAGGIFLLPYAIFSAMAGQLADAS
jgi:hypothetical protein